MIAGGKTENSDFVVSALGLRVRVHGLDPQLLPTARELWRELDAADAPARELRLDLASANPADPAGPPQHGLGAVAVQLNQLFLAEYAGFASHAGVIARDGRVVAMPATSGTGKTTMTAAACAQGWGYVSDEALCIDYATGALVGYPRPLGMSAWTAGTLGFAGVGVDVGDELLVAPSAVAARVVATPGPLTDVVVLDRETGVPIAELEPLPRPQIVPLLLQRSFNHYRNPDGAVRLVAAVASGARCWRLRYGDPSAGAKALSALWE